MWTIINKFFLSFLGKKIETGHRLDYFTMKMFHGGVYFEPPEEKYVGGSMEVFEGVVAAQMSLNNLFPFCVLLGYEDNVKLYYRIPNQEGEFRLHKIDGEHDVADMAAIGIQNSEVELYLVKDFHIRFLDSKLDRCNVDAAEFSVLKEDGFYVDITLDDCTTFEDTTVPVEVFEEEDACEVDDDAKSESTDAESFNDSDYDFSKDEDKVIFQKSVADTEKEIGQKIGETAANRKTCGSRNDTRKSGPTQTFKQESSKIKDRVGGDFNLYDGDPIPVHEQSVSINTQELNSSCESSDDDSSRKRKPKYVRFRPEIDMVDPKFFVGLLFDDKEIFKRAVDYYGVKWGKVFVWKKNDIGRMRAKCKTLKCGWYVYASKEGDSDAFVIRTMGPPCNCGRTFYHKRANSGFLSRHYMEFLRLNKKVTIAQFMEKVHLELNINITANQASKTFMKAKLLIDGNYKSQYKKLWDYCEELLSCNPGSTVHMDTSIDEDSGKERFQRLYICFEALKKGFKAGCRRVIGVDGCQLRGPHPGVLLTAIGIDANDCIYPIAYAVVEVENKNAWKWFIDFLKHDLTIYDQKSWTFISDRQKGLGSAIQEVIPGVEHRHCVRHLHNNMKKLHPGESIKNRFWACARSCYMRRFENEMEALREYDHNAHKWVIDNTNPSHWSRSHFKETTKCDILLNNLCESFNSVILEAREKPILGMLENIRVYLMERLRTKREWMKKRADNICPKIQIKLEKAKAECAANIARQSDDKRFEVTHIYGETYVVDLDRCSCTCRRWQLTGLPCCHAIACISFTEATPEQYVHKCYSRDAYLAAYEPAIAPISGPNAWKASAKELVLPPKKIRLPGRPKKARRREPDESRKCSDGVTKLSRVGVTSLSCSKCHEKGHTIRKCPLIIPQEQLNAHGSGRGPSLNTNRCSNCQVTGHNRRTCPQVHRREQGGGVGTILPH